MATAASARQIVPAITPEAASTSWFAACTCAHHEKRVLQYLTERNIEAFLPTYHAVHAWKDRKKVVELPLFPGYIFVRISPPQRLAVLQVPSIARFVSFNGRPAPLPEEQIAALRTGCEHGARFEPHPFLRAGARVRVRRGCLAGAEGVLVRRKQALRFVLSLELLNRAVSVEVDAVDIVPIR